MVTPDLERLARTAYEAHRDVSPGTLPAWENAPEQEQKAWRAAMSAVAPPAEDTVTEGAKAPSIVLQYGGETNVFHKEFTAGRQGQLAVGDEHASSHHALFQFSRGFWYVEDLNSTNGTWLNGRRMFAAQRLKKGDKVKIGRTVVTVLSV
jgi:pSer/pThr/pTyr-binding forkhead associated (FHA) protein